jgi:hypothetical protein
MIFLFPVLFLFMFKFFSFKTVGYLQVIHQPLSRPKKIRAGEYAGGRKNGLERVILCLSHLIYTVRPCLTHRSHSVTMLCHDHAVLKATSQGHGTARHRHGMTCKLVSAVQRRYVGDLSAFGYHAEFHEGCYQKHNNPLNCRTSSSGISGYHEEFHKGHGTV